MLHLNRLGLATAPVRDLPAEQIIAWARFSIALTALLAIYIDPTQPTHDAHLAYSILGGYVALAAAAIPALRLRTLSNPAARTLHFVDLSVVATVVHLTDGPSSPLFVLFTFAMLAATLRWNAPGALWTAIVLFVLLLALSYIDFVRSRYDLEINRVTMRGGYIVMAGAVLAYFGAHRERSQKRLHALASWPAEFALDENALSLDRSMAHAAAVLKPKAIAVIWIEGDAPERQFCVWGDGDCTYGVHDPEAKQASPVHEIEACVRAGDSSIATAIFRNDITHGSVFVLKAESFGDDLLDLCKIIASRLGSEIEHHALRRALSKAAAERERTRVTREVHDGLLQTLSAAVFRIATIARAAPRSTQVSLAEVQHLLGEQQERIRENLYSSRAREPASTCIAVKDFSETLRAVRRIWNCETSLQVEPEDLQLDPRLCRELGFLFHEAASNAVRHGRASRIEVAVNSDRNDKILVTVINNGSAIEPADVDGEHRHSQAFPQSISQRVDELGGAFTLSNAPGKVSLRIELPYQR